MSIIKRIKMHPVSSSNLAAVGYDPDRRLMRAEFKSGKTYEYEDVPEEIYKRVFTAESAGRYMREQIIDAGYSSKQV